MGVALEGRGVFLLPTMRSCEPASRVARCSSSSGARPATSVPSCDGQRRASCTTSARDPKFPTNTFGRVCTSKTMPTIFIKTPTHWTASINLHAPSNNVHPQGKTIMCKPPNELFHLWSTINLPDLAPKITHSTHNLLNQSASPSSAPGHPQVLSVAAVLRCPSVCSNRRPGATYAKASPFGPWATPHPAS